MSLSTLKNRRERGFFDGQFLIAMPGMEDRNFARTVIYICAHSDAGAMGFVINRPQSLTFTDVLQHLDMIKQEDSIVLPKRARDFPIQTGGPVESGRGFVLHSDDYASDLDPGQRRYLPDGDARHRARHLQGQRADAGDDAARLFLLGSRPAGERSRQQWLAHLPGQ